MAGFFYKLGQLAGPKVRKAHWVWTEATGTRAEAAQAEHRVGTEMARVVRSMTPLCSQERETALLTAAGNRLKPLIKSDLKAFHLTCMDSPNPQAFCLPGGFIFISNSMIELCDYDENLIAFILAHEIAHITEGHTLQRMLTHSMINAATRRISAKIIKKLGIDFLQSAYSQANEYQADKLAQQMTCAAGYHAEAGMALFNKICRFEQKTLLSRYFSTHPPCQERIRHLKQHLNTH